MRYVGRQISVYTFVLCPVNIQPMCVCMCANKKKQRCLAWQAQKNQEAGIDKEKAMTGRRASNKTKKKRETTKTQFCFAFFAFLFALWMNEWARNGVVDASFSRHAPRIFSVAVLCVSVCRLPSSFLHAFFIMPFT